MATEPDLPGELVERLQTVRTVGVVTGAGVSAESSIPTYRGKGGIYDDPEEGDRTIAAVSGTTLRHDPDRTWRAIARMARAAHAAAPNAAHRAIVEMERKAERFVLLTQNVDGLHQQAGSRNVIDIHGNVFATICMACGIRGRFSAREDIEAIERAPTCTSCAGTLRPDVVLFEELLPLEKVARIQQELNANPPDLLIICGTTALFPYIAEPALRARAAQRLTVEVNPEETYLSAAMEFSLRGPAGTYMPAIASVMPLGGGR